MVEQGWAIFDTEYLISNCEISMVPCIIIALSHNDQINCGALYSFQIISTQRYITNTVEYTTTLTHCEQGPCHANEQSWLFSSRPSVDHTYFASTEMSSFFNEIYITDRTGSCQIDNFQCSQWCGIVHSPHRAHSRRPDALREFNVCSWQWRHNGHDSVSNHQPHECLLNRLFRRRSKKTSNSASLVFVRGIHRGLVNSPHKWPVTRKMFPFDDVIMSKFNLLLCCAECNITESNVCWPNAVPTSVLSSRRWVNVSPTFLAVWNHVVRPCYNEAGLHYAEWMHTFYVSGVTSAVYPMKYAHGFVYVVLNVIALLLTKHNNCIIVNRIQYSVILVHHYFSASWCWDDNDDDKVGTTNSFQCLAWRSVRQIFTALLCILLGGAYTYSVL